MAESQVERGVGCSGAVLEYMSEWLEFRVFQEGVELAVSDNSGMIGSSFDISIAFSAL